MCITFARNVIEFHFFIWYIKPKKDLIFRGIFHKNKSKLGEKTKKREGKDEKIPLGAFGGVRFCRDRRRVYTHKHGVIFSRACRDLLRSEKRRF